MVNKSRCDWCGEDPLYVEYHDHEWGIPIHDDQKLFEFLILEGAQAGLSWITILRKREAYRQAFANFEISKVANFTDKDRERVLSDTGIVRNRLKINAAIVNAQAAIKVQQEFGSLSKYLWQFVDHKPIIHKFDKLSQIPALNSISQQMSKDLLKRGFKFVGPTICYAFMQATGMVNDHIVSCFRYNQIK